MIGATEVLGPLDLPTALARFHRRYPGLELELRTGLVAELLAALDSGEVDLVLGPIHRDLHARYLPRRLAEDEIVLIAPLGHPLPRSVDLTMSQVGGEPFVCLPPGSGLRAILNAAAQAAGCRAKVQFEAPGPGSIRALVSAGLGVALLARSLATADGPPVEVRALRPPPAHPPIGLIRLRRRRPTPAARVCADFLVTEAGSTASQREPPPVRPSAPGALARGTRRATGHAATKAARAPQRDHDQVQPRAP